MYCCDDNDLEEFILKVRELAKENNKLALFAITPEDGKLASDIVTLPSPKKSDCKCCPTDDGVFPPVDIDATKIKRSLCFSLTTFENSPASSMFCGPDLHGRFVCYPPW